MKLISPALLIEALAVRFPDCAELYSPEIFADFVTDYAKDSGFDVPMAHVLHSHDTGTPSIADVLRAQGLSPTGRLPSQPEYQHLRPSTAPVWQCVADKTLRPGAPVYDSDLRPMRTEHVSVDGNGVYTYSGTTRGPRMRSHTGAPSNIPKERKQHKAKDDKPYIWPMCPPGACKWGFISTGNHCEVCVICGASKP